MKDFYTNPRITQYNTINKGNLGHTPNEENTKQPNVNSIDDLPIHVDSIKNEIIKLQKYQDRFGYTCDIPNRGYEHFENYVSEMLNPTLPFIPREYASYGPLKNGPNEGLVLSLAFLGLYFLDKIRRNKD
jgi:hypothetical protein